MRAQPLSRTGRRADLVRGRAVGPQQDAPGHVCRRLAVGRGALAGGLAVVLAENVLQHRRDGQCHLAVRLARQPAEHVHAVRVVRVDAEHLFRGEQADRAGLVHVREPVE